MFYTGKLLRITRLTNIEVPLDSSVTCEVIDELLGVGADEISDPG